MNLIRLISGSIFRRCREVWVVLAPTIIQMTFHTTSTTKNTTTPRLKGSAISFAKCRSLEVTSQRPFRMSSLQQNVLTGDNDKSCYVKINCKLVY